MLLNCQSGFFWPNVTTARLFSLGLPCAGDLNFHPSCSAWFLRHWVKYCLIQVGKSCCCLGRCGHLDSGEWDCCRGHKLVMLVLSAAWTGSAASTNHFQHYVRGGKVGLPQCKHLKASSWSCAQSGVVWLS